MQETLNKIVNNGWNVEICIPKFNWPNYSQWRVSMVRGYKPDGTSWYAGQGEGDTLEDAFPHALETAIEPTP